MLVGWPYSLDCCFFSSQRVMVHTFHPTSCLQMACEADVIDLHAFAIVLLPGRTGVGSLAISWQNICDFMVKFTTFRCTHSTKG